MNDDFSSLLSPMKIGNVTFKNRMCVSPMGGAYGDDQDAHGEFSKGYVEYVLERARGGFGLFFGGTLFPDTEVDPGDSYFNFLNHPDDFIKMGKMVNEKASFYDMKIIQQLSFGMGRNYPGLYSCSENEVFGFPEMTSPVLNKDQIKKKVECVVRGSKIMKDCGFVGVEMHALHWGYLLDQFEMAITNHREDEYGGTLENRLRVCKELVEGIKQECGSDYLVTMRLGLKSYISGLNKTNLTGDDEKGRTLEETIKIAQMMESYGYDAFSVDVGQYDTFYHASAPMYVPLGHVIPLASELKKNVNVPVLCGSRMNDPYMSEAAVSHGEIDGVVLGRQSLADPHYVKKLEIGKPNKIRPCIGCLVGCMGKINSMEHLSCAVNPILQKSTFYAPQKALVSKKIMIIGGGIAGMEAARIAKMRGHYVTIYEKSDRLGGLLIAAGSHAFKKDIIKLVDWYISEIEDNDVPVEYNTEVTAEMVKSISPDAVIITTGSEPVMPPIKGIDHDKCMSGVDALTFNRSLIGQYVTVIGGGLVGCETAIDYAMEGKDVTLVEAAPAVLAASKMIPVMISQMIPDLLDYYGVKVMTNYKIEEINDEGAIVVPTYGGETVSIEADTVIMSIGMKTIPNFSKELRGCGIEVFTAGDAGQVGNVYSCVHSAYDVAKRI